MAYMHATPGVIAILVFYFLPSIVAAGRKVRHVGSVFVVNLFLGWTILGWVIALAMAARSVEVPTR